MTYTLESGKEDTVLLDQVLEYNKDTEYLREMLLYKLSLKARKLLQARGISKRELVRRLHTSPVQLYRLLDQTFTHKTIDQMIRLLAALDCLVDVVFKTGGVMEVAQLTIRATAYAGRLICRGSGPL